MARDSQHVGKQSGSDFELVSHEGCCPRQRNGECMSKYVKVLLILLALAVILTVKVKVSV